MPQRRRMDIRTVSTLSLALLAVVSCRPPKVLTIQRDPGTAGNGVEQQPGPYVTPPEMRQRLENAPEGKLLAPATFFSKTYNVNFKYRLYVPAQFNVGMAAAFMVFQDASSVYLGVMNTPTVLDNLIHAGDMPVTIALFIDPGTATGEYVGATDSGLRSEQYDTPDERYGKFLTKELIPIIRKEYRLVDDPNGWAIAGQSSGGFAAFNTAWWYSDFFHKVLTQNGSFVNIKPGGGDYPKLISTEPQKPLRVYLLSGTNDLNNQFGNWLEANRAMATALGKRDYDYRFRPGTGEHFPPVQAQADFADALRWLWRGYYAGRVDGK
ncbi:MAG: alpha/beta hydrolase-fold protein [Gemmatimonas sp.]